MKILMVLLILLIITSNSIISLHIKVSKGKITNIKLNKKGTNKFNTSRNVRNNFSNSFYKDIDSSFESISDSEALLDFVLGVMSAFYTSFSILFELKNLSKPILDPCMDVKAYKEKIKSVKLKLAPKTIIDEWQPMPPSVKFVFCKDKKKKFLDNSQRTFTFMSDECIVNKEEFIKVKSNFPHIKNEEEYKEECTYFKEMDCDMFKDGVDPLSFIDNAMSKFDSIKTIFSCISSQKDKLLAIEQFKELATVLAEIGAISVLTKVIGVTLQIVTLGIWGLVKASANLVLLSKNIYDYLVNDNKKLKYYLLGRITGEAINLGQSLLTGTKKRRRSSKFNKA